MCGCGGGLDVKEGWRRRGGVWRGCSPSNFICQNNKKHFFFFQFRIPFFVCFLEKWKPVSKSAG